jgi:hypothetical protein
VCDEAGHGVDVTTVSDCTLRRATHQLAQTCQIFQREVLGDPALIVAVRRRDLGAWLRVAQAAKRAAGVVLHAEHEVVAAVGFADAPTFHVKLAVVLEHCAHVVVPRQEHEPTEPEHGLDGPQ